MRGRLSFSSLLVPLCSVVILSLGCHDATRPTFPFPSPPAPPPAPPQFPDAPTPSGTNFYYRIPYNAFGGSERYVLYPDNKFILQYAFSGGFGYPGRFSQKDGEITFDFDGWSPAGSLQAFGTIRGDTLVVRYNIVMSFNDFVDGVFVRSP